MPRLAERSHRQAIALVAGLALAAVFVRWAAPRRPALEDLRGARRFVVTSPRDTGGGSLREAIYAADAAEDPVVIKLLVRRIVPATPLPPLSNPRGVSFEAEGVELDARRLGAETALYVESPGTVVRGLKVSGAAGAGIVVHARGVRLRNIEASRCADGVVILDGSRDVTIEGARFDGNGAGVRVHPGATRVTLRGNHFAAHEQAAIWDVRPEPAAAERGDPELLVRGNTFESDRISLIVVNVPTRIEGNELVRAREAAAYLGGPHLLVRDNRIRAGQHGLLLVEADDAVVEKNELDHVAAIGIVVHGGRGTTVRENRFFENGYGISLVRGEGGRPNVVAKNILLSQRFDGLLLLGSSAMLQGNRVLGSRYASVRILRLVPWQGPAVPSAPLLSENTFEGNGNDTPVRGDYVEPPPQETERR